MGPSALPVAASPPHAVAMERITVGVDDSDGARRALRWALDLAAETGARVEVVHAYTHYLAWIDRDQSAEEFARSQHVAYDAACQELDRVVAGVASTSEQARIEKTVLLGEPAAALTEEAAASDLLVVGSRGRGGVVGLVLGSISRRCTETARCPVVVVPANASE